MQLVFHIYIFNRASVKSSHSRLFICLHVLCFSVFSASWMYCSTCRAGFVRNFSLSVNVCCVALTAGLYWSSCDNWSATAASGHLQESRFYSLSFYKSEIWIRASILRSCDDPRLPFRKDEEHTGEYCCGHLYCNRVLVMKRARVISLNSASCFGFDLLCRCNEVSHVSRLFFQATSESVLSHNSCLTNPVIFILSLMFSHHAGWVIYSVVSRLMVSEHTCGI